MYGRWSLTASASGAKEDSGASVTKNQTVAKVTIGYRLAARKASVTQRTSTGRESHARGERRLVVKGKSWSMESVSGQTKRCT